MREQMKSFDCLASGFEPQTLLATLAGFGLAQVVAWSWAARPRKVFGSWLASGRRFVGSMQARLVFRLGLVVGGAFFEVRQPLVCEVVASRASLQNSRSRFVAVRAASRSCATPNPSFNGTAFGSPLTPTLGVFSTRCGFFWGGVCRHVWQPGGGRFVLGSYR